MFVILTSKPGQFHTEITAPLEALEAYDYMFCGRKRAHFVIARLEGETKVRIVEDSGEPLVNLVPSKFLPRFESIEEAREELRTLSQFGHTQASLVKC